MKRVIVFLFMCVFVGMSFAQKKDKRPERPMENWVFTANLDGRPDVMILALHEQIWIAYDRENCQLIKAWKGGVKIEEGGKNVSSNGLTFYQEDPEQKNGWKLIRNGEVEIPKTKMGTIGMVNDSVTLNYELTLKSGHVIWVQETPEAILREKNPNRCGLVRKITVGNMPLNSELAINMEYKGMLHKKDIKSDYNLKVISHEKRIFDFGTVHDMEVDALLNPVAPTLLKMMYTVSLEQASGGR